MDFGDSILKQKKRISSYITADVANKLFSFKIPYLLALPFNPLFNDYLEKKGVNPADVMSVAKTYVLPGKLHISKLSRNAITNELLSNLFYTKNLNFKTIKSKGEQAEFLAKKILTKQLTEGLLLSEQHLLSSGIITPKEEVTKYVNRLKNHFNPSAKKSNKVVWIENASSKKGKIKPLYEVDLRIARVNSKKNPDLEYIQEKGKSMLSAKSKILRVFHKEGFPLDNLENLSDREIFRLWQNIQVSVDEQLRDFNGLMLVGKSEPYGSPNSTINFFSSNVDKLNTLQIVDHKNYYSKEVREEEGKPIFAHHYKIKPRRDILIHTIPPEDLTLESKIVLSYSDVDFYEPISVHVKSVRNEIEDIFGKRAHNLYKHHSLINAYKSKLSSRELNRFEILETILGDTLIPDTFPHIVNL